MLTEASGFNAAGVKIKTNSNQVPGLISMNFIEPYTAEWKTEFEKLRQVLSKIVQDEEIDIQHVGSTAVPGMYAKPVLDIDIIISDKLLLEPVSARLVKAGYISRGEQGIAGRFAFRQSSGQTPQTDDGKEWQEHHLYLCFSDSLALKNHLLFRDALLNDPKLAAQYSELKISLAATEGMTREKYTRLKTDYIISALSVLGLDQDELDEIIRANR